MQKFIFEEASGHWDAPVDSNQIVSTEHVVWARKKPKLRLPDKAQRRPPAGRGRGFQPPGGPPRPVFKVPTPTAGTNSPNPVAAREAAKFQKAPGQNPPRAPMPSAKSPFDQPSFQAAQVPEKNEEQDNTGEQNSADKDKPEKEDEDDKKQKQELDKSKDDRPAYMEDRPRQVPESLTQKQKEEVKPQETAEKAPTSAQKPPLAVKKFNPGGQDAQSQQQSGFFNVLNGLLSYLQRKQAYMGKSSSAMYYSAEKGRYIIEGEEESDDDEPPPPPPGGAGAKKSSETDQQATTKDQSKGTSGQNEDDGAIGSMTAAFGGALAKRGRGRGGAGRGRGRAAPRFAPSFDPSQITSSEMPDSLKQEAENKPKQEEPDSKKQSQISESLVDQTVDNKESAALYQTAMDITQFPQPSPSINDPAGADGQTIFDNKDLQKSVFVTNEEPGAKASEVFPGMHQRGTSLNLTEGSFTHENIDPQGKQMSKLDEERYQLLYNKYMRQQNKVILLKERVKKYQQELKRCRDENEQTIENFTQLCQDLKYRGMDEVDDLQNKIKALQAQNRKLGTDKAESEFKIDNLEYELKEMKLHNSELELSVEKLREQVRADQLQLGSANLGSTTEQTSSNLSQQNQGLVAQGQLMSHQGVESRSPTLMQQDDRQIRLSLDYGNLTAVQAKERHEQLQKVLDLQCENDRLSWQIVSQKQQAGQLLQAVHQMALKLQDANSGMVSQRDTINKLRNQLNQEAIEHEKRIMEIENRALETQTGLKLQADKIQKERDTKKMEIVELQRQMSHLHSSLQQLEHQNQLLHQQHQSTLMKHRQLQQDKQQVPSPIVGGLNTVPHQQQMGATNSMQVPAQIHSRTTEQHHHLSEFVQDEFSPAERSQDEEGEEDDDDEDEEEEDDVTSSEITEDDQEEIATNEEEEEVGGEEAYATAANRASNIEVLQSEENNQIAQTDRKQQSNQSRDNSESPNSPRMGLTSPVTSIKKRSTAARVQRQIDQKMTGNDPSEEILYESQKLNKKDEIEQQIQEQFRKQSALQKKDKKRRQKRKTMQQILKEQIEESRAQQKLDFEKRLKVEKELHQCSHFLTMHQEGVRDIVNVLQGIIKSENIKRDSAAEKGRSSKQQNNQQLNSTAPALSNQQNEDNDEDQQQSSQIRHGDDNPEQDHEREDQHENSQANNEDDNSDSNDQETDQLDHTVEEAIQKIFQIQRFYQGQTTDLQHKLSVLDLKLESQESLTLDLEILQHEKMLSDQEILNLKSKVNQAHLQVNQVQQKLAQVMEEQARDHVKISASEGEVESLNRQIERQAAQTEEMRNHLESQNLKRIQDVRDNYENQVIPRLQQQADQRAQQMQTRFQEQIANMQSQYDDLQQQRVELDGQLNQQREDLKTAEDGQKQLQEIMKMKEVEKEELDIRINTLEQQHQNEISKLHQSIDGLQKQLYEQQTYCEQVEQQIADLRRENDQRCQELIEKRDQYKQQAKEYKKQIDDEAANAEKVNKQLAEVQKELDEQREESQQQKTAITELQSQLDEQNNQKKAQEEEVFWTMVNQVNTYKQQLVERQNTITDLEKQLEKVRNDYDQKLQVDLKSKDDHCDSQVSNLNSQWEQKLDKLKDQHRQEIQNLKQEQSAAVHQIQMQQTEQAVEKEAQANQVAELEKKMVERNEELQAKEQTIIARQQTIQGKDDEIDKMQREHNSQIEALKGELATHQDQNKGLLEQIDEVQSLYNYQLGINDGLNSEVESLEQKIVKLKGEKEQLQESNKVTTLDQLIQTEEEDANKTAEQSTIQVLKWSDDDKEDAQIKESEPKKEQIELKDQELKQARSELDKVKEELLEAQYSKETSQAEFEKREDELTESLRSLNKELEQAKEHLSKAQKELEDKTRSLDTTQQQLNEMEQSHKALSEQVKEQKQAKDEQQKLEKDEKESPKEEQITGAPDEQPKEQQQPSLSAAEWELKVNQLQQRERAYKDAAERLAETFKEKLKKEKDKAKKLTEQITMLLQQIETLEKEKQQLRQQMDEMIREQFSMIEQFETSKVFSFQIDNRDESMVNLSNIRKQIEMNLSNIDVKMGDIQKDRDHLLRNILQCLKNAGIEGVEDVDQMLSAPDDGMLEETLQKLEMLLQNYLEDKGHLTQVVQDNAKLQSDNEDLNNKNYDLRYDLQQSNLQVQQLETEKQEMHLRIINLENRIQMTDNYMNNSDQGRLVLKLRQQEEEAQLIKADLFQKIQMYEAEIKTLRSQLQQVGPTGQVPVTASQSNVPAQPNAEAKPKVPVQPSNASKPAEVQQPVPLKMSDSTFHIDQRNVVPQSSRATDDAYADMSVNKDLRDSKLSSEELNETRIKPSPTKSGVSSHSSPKKPAPSTTGSSSSQPQKFEGDGKPLRALANAFGEPPKPQQQSGILSSIASFFLTESEMKQQEAATTMAQERQGGQASTAARQVNVDQILTTEETEYEYYEYDDELEEGEEAI